MAEAKKVSQEDKIWGVVGYLWILSFVALAARKNNDFVRFHASQGALLFVISVVLMFVPMLGWLLNVLVLIAAVIGLFKAAQGEKWQVPVIGNLAKNFGDWIIVKLKL